MSFICVYLRYLHALERSRYSTPQEVSVSAVNLFNPSAPSFPQTPPARHLRSLSLPLLHIPGCPSRVLRTGCGCTCAEGGSGRGGPATAMAVEIYNLCFGFSYLCACPNIKIRTKSEISLCQLIKNFNCPFVWYFIRSYIHLIAIAKKRKTMTVSSIIPNSLDENKIRDRELLGASYYRDKMGWEKLVENSNY